MSENQGYTYTGFLGLEAAGRNLAEHLAAAYRHTSEAEWRERIAAGLVHLDGRVATPSDLLRAGQKLTWTRPPWTEPEAPLDWALLYEDEELLAVAKPSGLPTLPGGGFYEHTLLHRVRTRYPEASPLHRLGRGTSGLVLFARTKAALRATSEAWKAHEVEKIYRALIEGHPAEDHFIVEAPIGPIAHPLLGSVHAASSEGRPARSEARVVERRASETLVEVRIATGRPHQIRIHMAYAGCPLVGDPMYGPGGGLRGDGAAVPGDLGYHLHAWTLDLRHPRTGAPLHLVCVPPPLLRVGGQP